MRFVLRLTSLRHCVSDSTGQKKPCNYQPQIRCFDLCCSLMLTLTKQPSIQIRVTCIFTLADKVSRKSSECYFTYDRLARDRWGADWEKGRVTRWQTKASAAQKWTWNSSPAITALHHKWLHRHGCRLLHQATSMVSCKEYNWTQRLWVTQLSQQWGEVFWYCAMLSLTLCAVIPGRQTSSHRMIKCASSKPFLRQTLPV